MYESQFMNYEEWSRKMNDETKREQEEYKRIEKERCQKIKDEKKQEIESIQKNKNKLFERKGKLYWKGVADLLIPIDIKSVDGFAQNRTLSVILDDNEHFGEYKITGKIYNCLWWEGREVYDAEQNRERTVDEYRKMYGILVDGEWYYNTSELFT